MGVCEVCGNDYDKAMEVVVSGESHVFDSFECAIHALAPRCEHCDCAIIGHGVESGGEHVRSPYVNYATYAGRDHLTRSFSLVLAGGGF